MNTLLAAVLVGFRRIELMELSPRPLGDYQVRVDVSLSGICGSQLMEYRGSRGPDRWLPHLFGHEGVGTVQEVGRGVTKLNIGDRVGLTWIRGAGQDTTPIVYDSDIGPVNAGQVATLATSVVAAESRLYRLPSSVSDRMAVLLGCALPTGAGMSLAALRSESPRFVAVVGLGGVGLSALLATLSAGVTHVIAVDTNESRLEFARRLGVELLVNPQKCDIRERLKEVSDDRLDLVLESSGNSESLERCFEALSRRGRLVFASHPPAGERISVDPYHLLSGKQIRGSRGGGLSPEVDIDRLLSFVSKMEDRLESLLSSEFRLGEIKTAFDLMERGQVIRPLIRM